MVRGQVLEEGVSPAMQEVVLLLGAWIGAVLLGSSWAGLALLGPGKVRNALRRRNAARHGLSGLRDEHE